MNGKQKGITLVELIVAIGILGLVGGLGLTVYLQANKAFDMAEDRWIIQTDMRRLATFVNKNLRNAYEAEIKPGSFISNSDFGENDQYLYVKDNENDGYGEIMYKWYEDEVTDKILIGKDGGKYEYKINFSLAEDEQGNKLEDKDTLTYTINATKNDREIEDVTFESSLYLANMAKQEKIEDKEGNRIYFKSSPDGSGSPSPELSSFCFVATAAYGSKIEPAVKILRMFRDQYLLTNRLGRNFVKLYYKYSPPFAKVIEDSIIFKFLIRILLLPVVVIALLIIINKVTIPALAGILAVYFIYNFSLLKRLNLQK